VTLQKTGEREAHLCGLSGEEGVPHKRLSPQIPDQNEPPIISQQLPGERERPSHLSEGDTQRYTQSRHEVRPTKRRLGTRPRQNPPMIYLSRRRRRIPAAYRLVTLLLLVDVSVVVVVDKSTSTTRGRRRKGKKSLTLSLRRMQKEGRRRRRGGERQQRRLDKEQFLALAPFQLVPLRGLSIHAAHSLSRTLRW